MLIKKIFLVLFSVTLFFMLFACSSDDSDEKLAKPDIEIIKPWIRKMPSASKNTAGFFTINNNTGKPLVLKDVSLDWAMHAMIHESIIKDGMASMSHRDELIIEDSLTLRPGGLHIMIMGIEGSIDPSQTYNIRLHFADREPLAIDFKVGEAINVDKK